MAILVPCKFRAMQLKTPSWAGISTGGFSVFARSTICTCPVCVPGNASKELLLFGHRTQRPKNTMQTFWKTSTFTTTSLFTDRYQRLRHKKTLLDHTKWPSRPASWLSQWLHFRKHIKQYTWILSYFSKQNSRFLVETHICISCMKKADSCINLAKKWCSDKPFK